MLANVLPGIREIRAPLAAGYLWILCGWLIVELPSGDELEGPAQEVVDLAERVPDSVVLVAISFAAYLVGSLSEDLFTRVIGAIPGARRVSVEPVSLRRDLSGPAAASDVGESVSERNPTVATDASDVSELGSQTGDGAEVVTPPPEPHPLQESAQQALEQGAVQQEIARLGNSIERLESENALRLALLPPLAMLACYLAVAHDWLWALSLGLIPAFFAQIRSRDSRISRETETREQLIQTANLTAARELAYGRLRSVDEGRKRVLKRLMRSDLEDARHVIQVTAERGAWPARVRKAWYQTWESNHQALALRLSDEEWEVSERAYSSLLQLQDALDVDRPQLRLTDEERSFLSQTQERIEAALTTLDGGQRAGTTPDMSLKVGLAGVSVEGRVATEAERGDKGLDVVQVED